MASTITGGGRLTPYLRRRRFEVARPYIVGRVLDVGCHDGALAGLVPADRYVGVDINSTLIAEARQKHPDHTFYNADQIDPGEQFDTVVSLAVIEHVPAPAEWLRRWSAHLVTGGRLVLTTPHPRWEPLHGLASRLHITSTDAHDEHESLLGRQALEAHLRAAELQLLIYRRFLAGMNQLVVAERR